MGKIKFSIISILLTIFLVVVHKNVLASDEISIGKFFHDPKRMPNFSIYIGKIYKNFFLPKHNNKPLIVSHRGGSNIFPENTMIAIDGSVSMGVDLIEIDVCLTKDDIFVLNHDKIIDRVSDGTGLIRDHTLEDLKNFNFGKNFMDPNGAFPYAENKVPITTLEEVFQKYPNFPFIVEIKDTAELGEKACHMLLDMIKKYRLENKVLVTTNDYPTLAYFYKISNNNMYTAFISLSDKDFHNEINNYLFCYNSEELTPEQKAEKKVTFDDYSKKGLPVYYWTINEPEVMTELINNSVDGIITDRPDLLKELLNQAP